VAYSLLDERHLPSAQKRDSPIIMQHSDSSSSLSSRASTEPSSSAGSIQAEPDVEHKQVARQEEARRGQRSAAASLRPSRAGSTAGRALDPVSAAAGDAAAIALEPPSSTETPHGAVAEAEGSGALAGSRFEGTPSPAASTVDGCDADVTAAVAAGTLQQQPDDTQQHLSPAGSSTIHLPRASASAAHLGDVGHRPSEMPGDSQQQEDQQGQQLQQQQGVWPPQEHVAGAAVGPSTGQSGSEGVGVASPAFAAQPSSSHSSGTRPSSSQLRLASDAALAVAEANLPSFAERQRQQQQQHAPPEHLHKQQPQQTADQGMARASPLQPAGHDVGVDQLGPSATAGAAHEVADAGLQPDASDAPTSMALLAGASGQHLQAPGVMDSLAAATAATAPAADASAAMPAEKQAALLAAMLAVSATTPAAAEVIAEAAPGTSAPLDSSTAAAAVQAAAAAAAPGSEQPADGQAAAPDTSLPVSDPVRNFTLTLDLRTFQAGRRLPVALGSIYVTAWLPPEFIGAHDISTAYFCAQGMRWMLWDWLVGQSCL